jgi:hypothetical protein
MSGLYAFNLSGKIQKLSTNMGSKKNLAKIFKVKILTPLYGIYSGDCSGD